MPSPLGHTAFGLAVHELHSRDTSNLGIRKTVILVSVLANLPDIDVLIGLIFYGNGGVFHRGATHSIVFALVMSALISNGWRCWSRIPKLGFLWCFMLTTSHLLADAIFSSTPVSFFWPLERYNFVWYCGWKELIESFVFLDLQHVLTFFGCGIFIAFMKTMKEKSSFFSSSYTTKKPAAVKLGSKYS